MAVSAPSNATPALLVSETESLKLRDDHILAFAETEDHNRTLNRLVVSHDALRKAGYIMSPLTQKELELKKRCGRCHKSLSKMFWKNQNRPPGSRSKHTNAKPPVPASSTSLQASEPKMLPQQLLQCKYHPGVVSYKKWTCCDKPIFGAPCSGEADHQVTIYRPGHHEMNWKYHKTPSTPTTSSSQFVTAVALDCEMGSAESGESELIRLTAIDFFKGKVLVDSLVYPDVRMAHYNTRFSGVTRGAMEAARRERSCLFGRDAARKALWQFVGPDTIVIGHGANGDMTSLRWIHPRMTDTYIIESWIHKRIEQQRLRLEAKEAEEEAAAAAAEEEEAVAAAQVTDGTPDPQVNSSDMDNPVTKPSAALPKHPGLSLKALALARLGREIQQKGRGHDSLEDAMATRDLLIWHVKTQAAL